MNWAQVAMELVRAVRGARTQKSLSRALGYRSNVLFSWESGRDAPSARKFFRLVRLTGAPPLQRLAGFGRPLPSICPSHREGMREYLNLIAGNRTRRDLALHLGRDRFAVGRWFRADSEIPLPEFLQVVELCTLALVDFIACLVDPRSLPSIAPLYARIEAARQAASEMPWSHAIVHMVDLPAYKALPRHQVGWFASRLGISVGDETQCLELLVRMGRLALTSGRYASTEDLSVDVRRDPEVTRKLASFWMARGAERVLIPGQGRFAFNTFGICRKDFDRLKDLQSRYFAELRAIVGESRAPELVAVATFQLFSLAGRDSDE